jgi:predicted nucleic acid-binding Zn ribbon protein
MWRMMRQVCTLPKKKFWIPTHEFRMATYVYETIPQNRDETPQQFEVVQSMKDAPLLKHPETGQPVRRVVLGGYGLMNTRGKSPSPVAAPASKSATACGAGCACHSGSRIPAL